MSNKKKWRNKHENEEGYTFIETLAVIAVSAVLASGTVISAGRIVALARKTAAQTQIEQYREALQSYYLDCGQFPTTEQGLSALWTKPVFYPVPTNWHGPYIEREAGTDPWGNRYCYCASSTSFPAEVPEGLPFIIMSYGADGKESGEGEAADIVSWK